MRDWKKYWNSINTGNGIDRSALLTQIGKTQQKQPISEEQFSIIIKKIVHALSIEKSDVILDLCCGNGIVTAEIAKLVNTIYGIDYSQPLIEVAKNTAPANARYFCGSVLDDSAITLFSGHRFSKIYMHEALQHFGLEDFKKILEFFSAISTERAQFFIAGIPDKSKIFSFYNTEERRKDYFQRVAEGTEAIGTWWDRDFLVETARSCGMEIDVISQDAAFYTAHYRFDILVKKS